ncbi:hypothetical protein QN239_10425 [Mycolicibacterium sp. Y3]
MTTAVVPVTDADIDAAVLAALAPTDGEIVAWRSIRDQVPGDWWRHAQAVTRLFESGAIYCIKIGGKNYLSLQHGANAPGPQRNPRDFRVI